MEIAGFASTYLHPWDGPTLLDHAASLREPELLAQAWADPRARLLEVDAKSRFVAEPFGQDISGDLDDSVAFLGTVAGAPWFARRAGDIDHGSTIREAILDDPAKQLVSAGLAVLNWADATHYCASCAGLLQRTRGGFSASCTKCGREHFPRTDPAVIVAVLDPDDRLFLAHQISWPAGRVSILAGFVEAGESAENAVYRELAEEAQLVVDSARFLGSQPWPFPRSLMLSFVARSRSAGQVDEEELEWGGWYGREEVLAAEEAGTLILPGSGSVARRIVDAWLAGRLPTPDASGL